MFDIGFAELVIVAIVGLLVLGPERLPTAARSVAIVLARLRRQAGELRREIEQELDLDGIRRDIHNESLLSELKKSQGEIERTVADTRRSLEQPPEDPSAKDAQ